MTTQELERLGEGLGRRLEKELGSLLLQAFFHGGCVEGASSPSMGARFSLLLERVDATLLSTRLHPVLRRFEGRRLALGFVFTPEYIENARDVFPIEFLDFQARHLNFAGGEHLASLTIADADLRAQAERELRGLILHLRSALARLPWKEKPVSRLLDESAWTLVPIFRALLRLKGGEVRLSQGALIAGAAAAWKIETLSAAFLPGAMPWSARPEACLRSLEALLTAVDDSGPRG
ncbi:MAG: hypothetical protein J0L75_14560 [Spirochaetes bacterium]|nr:hypothetical protein [Spirochaetota bacterium]